MIWASREKDRPRLPKSKVRKPDFIRRVAMVQRGPPNAGTAKTDAGGIVMGFIIKPLIWTGIAGTLVGGTAFAIMGPQRAHALLFQARNSFNASVDSQIDDPVALRQQLRELEAQYPERISQIRNDHSQLVSQISQLQRERAISSRVVDLADADLMQMKDLLTKAEDARSGNAGAIVQVRFDNNPMNLDQAYSKANQISKLRSAYASRTADIDRDLSLLGQQEKRLAKMLSQLENERADFQSQLWQLDRQVDAIARNDRMIDMLQKRQKVFDNQDRYEAANADHVRGNIAQTLAQQEAKLASLANNTTINDYVATAETELNVMSRVDSPDALNSLTKSDSQKILVLPSASQEHAPVIEITPDGTNRQLPTKSQPVASKD